MSCKIPQTNGNDNKPVVCMKNNISFRSPLNDRFGLPNKPSVCTWHKDVDRKTTPHRIQEWKHPSRVYPDVLSAIGNTPLIKLNKIPQAEGLKCDVYAKCEFFNPGGSMKDRIAVRLVEDAEKQGLLKPGYTIIEPSSGNTGIGMALVAAIKGYRCLIVMPEKMSNEKVSTMIALGAEIIRVPVSAATDSPDGVFGVSHQLKKEIPNSIILDQFANPANPLSHYDTTAEEIYDQMDHKVDMIVVGTGTGGTITGIGRKFKEISPQTQIIAADPEGSVLAQPDDLNKTDVTFFEVEGVGYDFLPTTLDRQVIDKWIKTNDTESLPMARRLIREEGLLVGSSSGTVMASAIKAARNLEAGKRVVVVLADGIRNYITKFVSDQWMEARSLKPCENTHKNWWWDVCVSSVKLVDLQKATTNMTCDRLLNTFKKFGVDQIPVTDNNNGMIGVVTLQNLMHALNSGKVQANSSIERCIVRIYPKVYNTANLGVISRILETESYVLILESHGSGSTKIDKPVGIMTAIDLLQYISDNNK